MDINKEKYFEILKILQAEQTLIVVSKTRPLYLIQQFYKLGQRHFGENRIDELIQKKEQLPDDIVWHFIGQVQSRQIKKIVAHSHCIHSLSQEKHFELFSKAEEQFKVNREYFIQVNVSADNSKAGFSKAELNQLLLDTKLNAPLNIKGLMTILSLEDSSDNTKAEVQFNILNGLNPYSHLSMGMSGDYLAAIKAGTTHLRIGSVLFH